MVIDTAINGNADIIVSGDKDLTDIEKYKNIKILSAKQFLDSQTN
jgi:predicted nucleic acid-binding protein